MFYSLSFVEWETLEFFSEYQSSHSLIRLKKTIYKTTSVNVNGSTYYGSNINYTSDLDVKIVSVKQDPNNIENFLIEIILEGYISTRANERFVKGSSNRHYLYYGIKTYAESRDSNIDKVSLSYDIHREHENWRDPYTYVNYCQREFYSKTVLWNKESFWTEGVLIA